MRPTLPPDCEIEVTPTPSTIPLGALLVFAGGSSLVAHRLIFRTRSVLITQGDNQRRPDQRLRPDQVLGVVTAAYRGQHRIWPGALEPVLRWWWIGRATTLWTHRRLKRYMAR